MDIESQPTYRVTWKSSFIEEEGGIEILREWWKQEIDRIKIDSSRTVCNICDLDTYRIDEDYTLDVIMLRDCIGEPTRVIGVFDTEWAGNEFIVRIAHATPEAHAQNFFSKAIESLMDDAKREWPQMENVVVPREFSNASVVDEAKFEACPEFLFHGRDLLRQ